MNAYLFNSIPTQIGRKSIYAIIVKMCSSALLAEGRCGKGASL